MASWRECQAFVIIKSSKLVTTATFKDLRRDFLHKTHFWIYNQSVGFLFVFFFFTLSIYHFIAKLLDEIKENE